MKRLLLTLALLLAVSFSTEAKVKSDARYNIIYIGNSITYGWDSKADYVLENCEKVKLGNILGVAFDVKVKGEDKKFTVALPGEINAHNSLIALAIADIFGISDDDSAEGLKQVFVKGRCEIMKDTDDITVIIDYAHNGVSLKSIIDTARAYEHNRIITLFGSVGGRTECRREELGTVSGKMSDFTIITSDDPDFEDPQSICEEIASYCKEAGGEYVIFPDRSEAVNYAVKMAVISPFSDRIVCAPAKRPFSRRTAYSVWA